MSEELNKEMDELEEADKATAKKIVKHEIGDDEQGDPDMDKGIKKAADNKTKGKPTSETKKVEEGELPPALAKAIAKKKKDNGDDDEEDDEEEEELTKKEAVQVPKLKSEILAGLVDHLRGLKKEDLSKMYGSTVLGEQEDDEEDEDEDEDEDE